MFVFSLLCAERADNHDERHDAAGVADTTRPARGVGGRVQLAHHPPELAARVLVHPLPPPDAERLVAPAARTRRRHRRHRRRLTKDQRRHPPIQAGTFLPPRVHKILTFSVRSFCLGAPSWCQIANIEKTTLDFLGANNEICILNNEPWSKKQFYVERHEYICGLVILAIKCKIINYANLIC